MIFLVGYMGCGKTTIGRPLAALLNYQFIDLDREIEERYAMSITDMFNLYGESCFRRCEQEVLLSVCAGDRDLVVSTGGGTPCYENNMEIMNNIGTTVYINLDTGMICSRLMNSKKKRPLIAGKTDDELKEFVSNNIEQRELFYGKAKIKISGKSIKAADVHTILSSVK